MVKICNTTYPSNSKYDSHFELYPYPLSDFQKYAIEAIVEKQHVLITAHTGSGKTLPAEFAIQHFTSLGKKVIYTSPIKALSNQKYYEFTKKYPHISFGLFTGDIKTNPEADVLIMTTEILMNYLFTSLTTTSDTSVPAQSSLQFQIDIQNELACVVFDEVHYINDAERGQTWEKTILMLPRHIQMVMLSATIDNPEGFAKWCEKGDTADDAKCVYLASTNHRVVPLSHYGYITTAETVFKHIKDKTIQKDIKDTTNKLIPLQDETGVFNEVGYKNIVKINKLFDDNKVRINRKHTLNQLALFLREREMLPAIAFVFSRKNVELCASEITVPLTEEDSNHAYNVRNECDHIVRKLPNYKEYMELPEYIQLVRLLEQGIGIHHSGMIPILREIVELMISKRYIKLLFATESFAIGLDCPIKTAVFTGLTKFDGNLDRYLMAHEYTQMAGRAGRRGIDTVGHVVHCNNLFKLPTMGEYKTMMGGKPQKLISKFRISYPLIFNLLKNGQSSNFHQFSQKSMVQQEIMNSTGEIQYNIQQTEQKIAQKIEAIASLRTPRDVCETYITTMDIYKNSVNKKQRQAERDLRAMEDDYKYIKSDVETIGKLTDMEIDLQNQRKTLDYTQTYILEQTKLVCAILVKNGFIRQVTTTDDTIQYEMTELGGMASNLAEIHPLPIAQLMVEWNFFADFSPVQLVGLLSCFTDIKLPSDMRTSRPNCNDTFLNNKILALEKGYHSYQDQELQHGVNTGIDYNEELCYDIIDFSMIWCDCTTEYDCKSFIQNEVAEKSISIGDFTKAMLKIVTITKEFMNIAETIGNVELKHKLNHIEGLVLKYVTTSQSLYV
jgi:superfamily II RNA helicase